MAPVYWEVLSYSVIIILLFQRLYNHRYYQQRHQCTGRFCRIQLSLFYYFRVCTIITIINSGTSVLGGFVVFSYHYFIISETVQLSPSSTAAPVYWEVLSYSVIIISLFQRLYNHRYYQQRHQCTGRFCRIQLSLFYYFRDCTIIAIINSGTSVLGGFVVFSVLGFMAKQQNVDIDEVADKGITIMRFKPWCVKPPGHNLCTPEPGRPDCVHVISIQRGINGDAYPVAVSQKMVKHLPVSFYSPTPWFKGILR